MTVQRVQAGCLGIDDDFTHGGGKWRIQVHVRFVFKANPCGLPYSSVLYAQSFRTKEAETGKERSLVKG